MRSNFIFGTGLAVAMFTGGLMVQGSALARPAVKNATQTAASSTVVDGLQNARQIMSEADHDYKGHRVMAMREVEKALKELGIKPTDPHPKKAGSGKAGEPQPTSDAQMHQALSILKGFTSPSTTGNSMADSFVNSAIAQINTALSIK